MWTWSCSGGWGESQAEGALWEEPNAPYEMSSEMWVWVWVCWSAQARLDWERAVLSVPIPLGKSVKAGALTTPQAGNEWWA